MDQRAPLIPGHEAILDRLISLALCAGPVEGQTDKYFTNTSRIVAANGDSRVTFAVFMRRRVVAALEPAIRLIRHFVPDVEIRRFCAEGDIVPFRIEDARDHRFDAEALRDRDADAAEDRLSLCLRQQCL
jgi:nicotinate phosphoribosyltransferase